MSLSQYHYYLFLAPHHKGFTSDRYFVATAYEFGIFGGKKNGQFDPNGKMTRSQMAKVLYKTLQIAKMI
ncbi:S-layer homology domain-containing protein [Solibacillus sp. FSL K6-1554]|uniref:S-layer homology domain-containing protein n=1 Tax=Solibacillus sp. FSL K6-1554 TaxID=2921472 RepID=UPI0030F532D6